MADNVNLDEKAVFELFNSPDGPVGRLLRELSDRAAAVARSVVRIRHTRSRGRSDAYAPGFTLASIRTDMYTDAAGLIYGGIAAAYEPTMFLEDPAEQMHREYPFLTTGIDSLEGLL